MIIDAHTHIGKFGGAGKDLPVKSAKDLIHSMDKAEIALSLVIANKINSQEEGISNEDLILELQEFSDRLRAIAAFDFLRLYELGYSQELLSLLQTKQVAGLKHYLGYEQYDPCDERITPFYEVCQAGGMPVIFHTGYLLEGELGDVQYSHPAALGAVAKKFPKLNIIAAHFGNPWVQEMVEVMQQNQNVYADLSGYFTEFRPVSKEEIQEFQGDVQKLRRTLGNMKRFLFGTDYWLYDQEEYVKAVQTVPFSPEEQDLVFWKNAKQLFSLEV